MMTCPNDTDQLVQVLIQRDATTLKFRQIFQINLAIFGTTGTIIWDINVYGTIFGTHRAKNTCHKS